MMPLLHARHALTALIAVLVALSLTAAPRDEEKPVAPAARPIDTGGMPYQREEVYEFTEAPAFRKLGPDRYEIQFASKGKCDATVAVLDAQGKIIRHLVSGVLGGNAPEPLVKDSLRQTLVWDGKNDLGRYVDQPETCRVRVSLGLKPVFDKVLLWHPKLLSTHIYGLCCDEHGIYLFDSNDGQPPARRFLVFDHQGEYVRQIMPPPRDKISLDLYPLYNDTMLKTGAGVPGEIKGKTPSGKEADGPPHSLRLPTGQTIITPDGVGAFVRPLAANSLSVAGGLLTAVGDFGDARPTGNGLQFFQVKTDGSPPAGGHYSPPLGPRVAVGQHGGEGPRWTAASTDREWIYLSGCAARTLMHRTRFQTWGVAVRDRKEVFHHAVYRAPYDLSKPVEVFLGDKATPGDDNSHFHNPEGIACDPQGRIYVADNGNNRVQVFSAEGKFLKTIPVADPYQTAIHPRTGDIYVLSYVPKSATVTVTKFSGLDAPKVQATLSLRNREPQHVGLLPPFCLDSWTKEPTIWLLAPDDHVQLWTDKGDHFELARDLTEDFEKEARGPSQYPGWGSRANFEYGRIVADPYRPFVCLGPTWKDSVLASLRPNAPWVNTDTGEVVVGPWVATFGHDGMGYTRVGNQIFRIDPVSGKRVAFDYGEGTDGRLRYQYASGEGLGLAVAVDGKVALHDRWPPNPGMKITREDTARTKGIPNYMRAKEAQSGDSTADLEKYPIRQQYPGRIYSASSAVLLYDPSGQMKTVDLIEGIPITCSGLRLDFKGNVYLGISFAKVVDGVPLLGNSLCKFGPKGGRIIANGPNLKVPLKEPPNRPADFIPYIASYDEGGDKSARNSDKAWGEGMLWSFAGYYAFVRGHECICINSQFDLDFFARSYVPESYRQSVAVLDTNGNFILRLGSYGNADDRGPDIRFGYCRYVAVSPTRLYVNDMPNRRVLSINLTYHKEATAELK